MHSSMKALKRSVCARVCVCEREREKEKEKSAESVTEKIFSEMWIKEIEKEFQNLRERERCSYLHT